MDNIARDILLELTKRESQFSLKDFTFDEQFRFIADPAKFKTAVCSRRAGKTISCAADLTATALDSSATVSLYITLSRLNAKRIIWGELLEINRMHSLGAHANESELSLTFPNRSRIYLSGAKDKAEIEKFRGLALKKVYIDEAQSFRSYIQELIDEVLSKALFDHDGTLCLLGTPGPVPAGYFYECSTSPTWSHHGWTMLQNPFLELKSGKKPLDLILSDCKRMGVDVNDPKIQRECFGKWVVDSNSLVLRYDPLKNHYDTLPDGKAWGYVMGVDLGYQDADAISIIGWPEKLDPQSYLIEESVKTKQGITELAGEIERLIKVYNPLAIVMDTGGLGKKIAEELRKRYALPIKAAEKVRKFEYLELLNDALRTGTFKAKKDSRFAQDSYLLEWDKDKSGADRLVVSEGYHSDIIDSVLYCFREAQHWLEVKETPRPKVGTDEWAKEQMAEMEAQAQKAIAAGKRDPFDPASWEVTWDS